MIDDWSRDQAVNFKRVEDFSMSLHGDGISDQFFELLWQKDELNFGPNISVPDTVIFRYGKPTQWYFSGIDGKIKKKNKQNLINVRIEEAFTRRAVGCDLVACYIETAEEGDEDGPSGVAATSMVEYFDRKGLHDFLYNRFKQKSGVLQRFIEPQGTNNSMIRAIWSPKVCLLERRVNNHQLQDIRFGLYERAVTYEGPDYLSEAAPLRGEILPSALQSLCDTVVSHISEVSFQKQQIARMVLNFKVDSRERIWLMYSSSIRLMSEMISGRELGGNSLSAQPLNIDSVVKLPRSIKLDDRASHALGGKRRVLKSQRCVSCGKNHPMDQFHATPYKSITAHFDQVMMLVNAAGSRTGTVNWPPDESIINAAGGVGFGMSRFNKGRGKDGDDDGEGGKKGLVVTEEDIVVPPILRQLHPKLSASVFKRYRRDPLFLFKSSVVCEDCYLVFAELMSTPNLSSKPAQFVHPASTQSLKPDRNIDWNTAPNEKTAGMKRSTRRRKQTDDVSLASGISAPAPTLPAAIHDASAISAALTASYGDSQGNVEEMIQAREDAFFKEIAAEPSLRKGHPLSHLVSAQSKLHTATVSSNKDNMRTRAVASPYAQTMAVVNTERVNSGNDRLSRKQKNALSGGGMVEGRVSRGFEAMSSMSESSSKHKNFLLKTLNEVQHQLTTPDALKTFVEQHTLHRDESDSESEEEEDLQINTERSARETELRRDSFNGSNSRKGGSFMEVEEEEYGVGEAVQAADDIVDKSFTLKPSSLGEELLRTAYHVEGKYLAIKVFECPVATSGPDKGLPYIVFDIVFPLKSQRWSLRVDILGVGLEPGAWEVMPMDEKQALATHMLDELQWVGDNQQNIRFAFS